MPYVTKHSGLLLAGGDKGKGSLKNKFAILRLKCVADLADLIERNHRRSCSTSRISRMKIG